MKKLISKIIVSILLLSMCSESSLNAYYRRYGYHRGHGGRGAAIGIGAGLAGLAIGSAIASRRSRSDYLDYRNYKECKRNNRKLFDELEQQDELIEELTTENENLKAQMDEREARLQGAPDTANPRKITTRRSTRRRIR
jgi:hypothetical protein